MFLALSTGITTLSGCSQRTRYTCPPPHEHVPANGYSILTGGDIIHPHNQSSGNGTLGLVVHDRETGRPMALTNAHVVYGSDSENAPFPKGKQMDLGFHDFGTVERGLWSGTTFPLVWPPDYALVNIENTNFAFNSEVKEIGAVGGVGEPFVNQRVKYYNNRLPQSSSDPPMGVVYGTVTEVGPTEFVIVNDQPGVAFGVGGNSGSVVIENETGRNLVVGLLYSVSLVARTGAAQPISYVLDKDVNPDALDATVYDPEKHPVALFRYLDKKDGSHIYTTDWQELAFGDFFFNKFKTFEHKREGALFKKMMTYQGIEMIPLMRFYNQDTNDTIYTTDPAEIVGLKSDDAWCELGATGYLPPVEIPGKTTKLWRFYNGSMNQHFYTTDFNEVDQASGWTDQGFYWVFSRDGDPDAPTSSLLMTAQAPNDLNSGPNLSAITGPSDATIAVDPSCSTVSLFDGEETPVSGTVDLTIEPGCTGPACGLTIAKMHLDMADFNVGTLSVAQAQCNTHGYPVGTWHDNGTFVLPSLSTTVVSTFDIDGSPSVLTLTNVPDTFQGTLNRDYSSFTLSGELADMGASFHFDLCGYAVGLPPVAVVTPPGPFQCNSPGGADVTFSAAQSSDPDSDIEGYMWRIDNRTMATQAATLSETLPLGAHTVSVTVSDSRGASSTAAETVMVVDATPPVLDVTVSPDCLFPPNHKYVLFTLGEGIQANATDTCDSEPQIRIVNVTSNQPNAGDAAPDFTFGSGALCVRAERDAKSNAPRKYTVTVEATDHSGNTTTKEVTISVPHKGKEDQSCNIAPELVVDDDDPRCVEAAP
jgi:hypothetical protein